MIAEPIIPTHRLVVQGLRAKLQAGVRAAWIAGQDFAHGPLTTTGTDPFSTQSLHEKWTVAVECKGGPCSREIGLIVAQRHDWSHYPRPDFTEGELRRFIDGRHDWRDGDWQDHCGLPGCELCERGEVASHAIPDDQL